MRRALLLFALAACGDNEVPAPPTPRSVEVAVFPRAPVRDLDLLFMIDDSNSTSEIQGNLARAVPRLLEQLALPTGALPNLHVGVITSDMGSTGTGDYAHPAPAVGALNNGGCGGHGKDGVLQTSVAMISDRFVTDLDDGAGGRARNYTGALADVLHTMFMVGSGGCEFEQPLFAITHALEPATNPGFERPAAHLGVIVLMDEDDCSFRDPRLLDANLTELGPLHSFRCTEQGVACRESLGDVGTKHDCAPREDSRYMDGVDSFVGAVLARKPRGSSVTVAGIVGNPEPFQIELRAPPGGGAVFRALAHSCSYTGGTPNTIVVSDPAVRIASFIAAFGARGTLTSVCSQDLSAQLLEIGRLLKQPLGTVCLDTSALLDTSPVDGVQPACTVDEDGVAIPACPADGTCFELVTDPVQCPETPDHVRLALHGGGVPDRTSDVHVHCELPSSLP